MAVVKCLLLMAWQTYTNIMLTAISSEEGERKGNVGECMTLETQ
jgi:hypothetical protein